MSQQTKLPGVYNPYKASRQTSKRDMSAVNAFWERTKGTNPTLFQKHQREKAALDAQGLIIDAMLDTPEGIRLMDELYEDMMRSKQDKLTTELSLLGVEAGATKREIRNAYRRKARKLHPDVGGDAESFKQLHAAYRALLKVAHD